MMPSEAHFAKLKIYSQVVVVVEIAFVNTASQSHLPVPRDKVLLVNYTPRYFRNMQTDENQPSFPHHRLGLPDMIIHVNVLIFIFWFQRSISKIPATHTDKITLNTGSTQGHKSS